MALTKSSRGDLHMGEPGFLRKLVRRRKLESVFLFVTSKCNSKCKTCFYATETHPGEDLSFEEIARLSQTGPAFDKLWLSGGEPFLRKDLVEIIELFYKNNSIQGINLPTNGLVGGEHIGEEVARLLDRCPKLTVHLNYSVDGLGEVHDRQRGVPGAFAKTMAAMEATKQRFAGNPRIHQNVATVITAENIDQVYDLGLYLLKRFKLSAHAFEAVRGQSRDPELARATEQRLEALHRETLPLYDAMATRLFEGMPAGGRNFAKLFFVGMIQELYRMQRENVGGPKPWGMDCTAGETTLVIDHDGGFRACELRPRIGNVKDFGCDLNAVCRSPAMRAEIEALGGAAKANCWCSHTCWILSSMKFSPKKIVFDVPRAFARARLTGYSKIDPDRIDLSLIERRWGVARA